MPVLAPEQQKQTGIRFRLRALCQPVPAFVGLVLALAAVAKLHQLATDLTPEVYQMGGPWVEALVIAFEVVFAFALWSEFRPGGMRWAAIGLFTLLAVVSVVKGVRGDESCGCFGKVTVSPWVTALIDAGCVCALVGWRPRFGQMNRIVFAVGMVAGLSAGVAAGLAANHLSARYSRVVTLKPTEWVGQKLPLTTTDVAGLPANIRSGQKRLVFVEHGCPACDALIRTYQAAGLINTRDPPYVFVQVPNARGEGVDRTGAVWAKLNPQAKWFVRTPTVVELEDGVVAHVSGR